MKNKKFKICMVNLNKYDSKYYADTMRVMNILNILEKGGIDVIMIATNKKLFTNKATNINRFPIYELPSVNIRFDEILSILLLLPTLLYVINKHSPNLVFVNSQLCAVPIYLTKIIYPKLIIQFDVMGISYMEVTMHKYSKILIMLKTPVYKFFHKLLAKSADFITTVNIAHKEIIEKHTKKPVYVVRDAVNINNLDNVKKEVPPIKKEVNDIFIIFVGSIGNKRLDEIFNIFPESVKRNPDLKFIIIGDGVDKEYYCKIANDLGLLNKNIFFTGYVDNKNMFTYLSLADICYSDDWSEIGFPVKVFEYMAMGKVVITKDTQAIREVVKDGENGLLYTDEKDLLEKIITLSKNKLLREKLGENARKYVLKYHTMEKRYNEWIQIYNQYTK